MSTPEGKPVRKLEQKESPEERAVRLTRELEESKDPEFVRHALPELFALLEKELRISLLKGEEIQAIYKQFQTEECLIRVENFTRIMEALELNHGFKVGESVDDTHYANAVIPDPEGIRLAFSEGQASGPLRLAIGLGKSLVGFRADSEHIKVSKVDFSEDDARDVGKRAYLCRHIEGQIEKDDIRGVVMRIPRNIMHESLLTGDEVEGESQFLFRGFLT
jgi:hypothetical protein